MTKVLWHVFQEEVFKICTIYLDDVCVMGMSFQDQLNNLERIFKNMDEHNLQLNTKKCKFFTRNAQQLSHVIQNGEVRPAEESVEAYKNMKSPKTIKDVRAPLSSFSYYRKFMKNFTRISKPINELIRGVNDKAKNQGELDPRMRSRCTRVKKPHMFKTNIIAIQPRMRNIHPL